MRPLTRRDFLNESALLASASALLANTATRAEQKPEPKSKVNSTEKLRVAIVGVRGRGMSHVSGFLAQDDCVITTICDADSGVIKGAMEAVSKKYKQEPKFEQ